ncbi:hypothetical protein EXIGLDRAFT_27053 [Exidia glandulosa HHB12029]|uniref:Uncharacterized protein n=1 Tax=Exidia glandulosa HHB12029 TaxID=1314781 RepID=A0A165P8L7_EXIGL|nr:hypothetical protein EXIGLDRAFT_27053 [Exidia glandulosa HHB12029]
MACLLRLPPEIRDIIIEHALLARAQEPADTDAAALDRIPLDQEAFARGIIYTGEEVVQLPATRVTPNSLGLLLVNRQLSGEVLVTIERLRASARLTYVLDIMVVQDALLWPTWLSVPAISATLDRVEVTFRAFGARSHMGKSAWNGLPPSIVLALFWLLKHFVLSDKYFIRSLVLDFSDSVHTDPPDDATKEDWITMHQLYRREVPADIVPVIPRAAWYASTLERWISYTLSMGSYGAAYGRLLLERIGYVTINAGDHRVQRYDLAARLTAIVTIGSDGMMWYISPPDLRRRAFWDWIEDTAQGRLVAGLPVELVALARPEMLPRLTESETIFVNNGGSLGVVAISPRANTWKRTAERVRSATHRWFRRVLRALTRRS